MTSQTIYAYTDIHKNTVMVGETDLNFTGTWSSTGTYWADPKDSVLYGNTQYIAIVDNIDVVPTFVPKKGQRKWSELTVIRAGTHFDEHTIDEAFDLAAQAKTIAIAGTNAAAAAQTSADNAQADADSAQVDAAYASGLAFTALQTAWTGTAGAASAAASAASAASGVNQALQIVTAGTNQEQADHVAAMAAAQVALQTAWTGTSAAAAAQSTGVGARTVADSAYAIAVAGTAAAAAAQSTGNGARTVADSAYAIATSGTGTANANAHERVGFSFVLDGGGAVITSGFKGNVEVPFAMWLNQWTLVADQAGSLIVDITKSNQYAGFPAQTSITDADRPTLNNAQKNQNTNPSAWVRQLDQGDILGFVVVGAGTIQSATVALSGTRS